MSNVKRTIVAVTATIALAIPASAAADMTITPGTTSDPDPIASCSLRAALLSANTNDNFGLCPGESFDYGNDTITLNANTTYVLTIGAGPEDLSLSGDLDVIGGQGTVTITSPGGAVIDASGLPAAFRDRAIEVLDNAVLSLSGVSIRGGLTVAADDDGGGILSNGQLTMSNGDLSSNEADGDGGGIASDGDGTTLNNVTVSDNEAGNRGGGLFDDDGALSVVNTTISDNHTVVDGGGTYSLAGDVFLTNSILYANTDTGDDAPDCGAGGKSLGTSVIGTTTGCSWDDDLPTDLPVGTNPLLGPLTDNGGGTLTHALLPGSPAIDRGASCLAKDQRGVSRPQGPACDIGAFEVPFTAPISTQPPVVTPPVTTPASATKKCKKGKKLVKVKGKRKCKKKKKKGKR